jgi:SAM-dependent methyltransferase
VAAKTFRGFSPEVMEARCRGRMLDRRIRIVTDLLRSVDGLKDGPVVEFGAGTGLVLSRVASSFPGVRFTAVEPVGEYVRYARATYGTHQPCLEYREGTVEGHGLPDASASCAYSINVWHHVAPSCLRAAAASAARVLRRGGRLIIMEPNFRQPYIFLYQGLTRDERHFLPRRELAALCEFFTIEKRSFYFIFPEPWRVLSAWMLDVEQRLESCPFLAGAVVYVLRKA